MDRISWFAKSNNGNFINPTTSSNHSDAGLIVYSMDGQVDHSSKICLTLLVILTVTTMIIAIFANFYVLRAIYICRRLHKTSSYLIANLAISDFLTALIVLPPMAYSAINRRPLINDTFCQISAYINYIIFGASLNTTMSITIDRCIAVMWPFRYQRIMTPGKTAMMLITAWLFPGIVAILPLLPLQDRGLGRYKYTNTTFYCGLDLNDYDENFVFNLISAASILNTIVVVLIAYIIIFRIAYKKWSVSRAVIQSCNGNSSKDASLLKTIRTTALIVGTNIICWLPAVVQVIISLAHPYQQRKHTTDITGIVFVWLPYTNCALNPLIYISSNTALRQLLAREWGMLKKHVIYKKSIIKRGRTRSRITPIEPTNSFTY